MYADVLLQCAQAIAEETKAVVQKEEAEATRKAQETQAIADDAQRDLNEALPALVSTTQCLLLGLVTVGSAKLMTIHALM